MFEISFNLVINLSKRRQRQGIAFLILITSILCGSIIQSVSYSSGEAAYVLQVHLGLDTHTVYHAEQFNMSLSILNVYGFEDVLNVSINVKIPEELQIISMNLPDLDPSNVTDELNYTFGRLSIDEMIRFRITYNVTSTETKSIALQSVEVTYQLKNGISGSVMSNTENIGLRGIKQTTTTALLRPIPIGIITEIDLGFITIPASPFFSVIGYLVPLLFFGMSIIVLRRLRYVKS
ncbi:MAG: hypothetical protein ACFFDT_08940 [Candidatus Hodarchaeota archaeon]